MLLFLIVTYTAMIPSVTSFFTSNCEHDNLVAMVSMYGTCVQAAFMEILTNEDENSCKAMIDTIESCYDVPTDDKNCFSREEISKISGAAVRAALEGKTDLADCDAQIFSDVNEGYETFSWLEFVTSDNRCSDEEKREADDILDNCLESETEVFYQEMTQIPSFAKKIWSCSVLEKTVWKCSERVSYLPVCFSGREKYFLAEQLSDMVTTVFQMEQCSFFKPDTGREESHFLYSLKEIL